MLEKFTPNQRLLLAVALSFAFFIGYTTLFPPKAPNGSDVNKSAEIAVKQTPAAVPQPSGPLLATIGDVKTVKTDTLATINSTEFTLKIDTLGRISSIVLKNAKHDNKEGKLAELISPTGPKPLQVRFADEALEAIAQKTPYASNVDDIVLGENGKAEILLTQSLNGLSVTKKVTFYADGHYDVAMNLSEEKRYFVYLGQHPQINTKMMTVTGGMVYAGDNKTTIFADGDVEGREGSRSAT